MLSWLDRSMSTAEHPGGEISRKPPRTSSTDVRRPEDHEMCLGAAPENLFCGFVPDPSGGSCHDQGSVGGGHG